jgi:hypothetical protein
MRKIKENRSLFYNLLDFARMSGGDKGGSVEDMFGGPGTELDAICHEYVENNKENEWKITGEIWIPSRSTFGRHRKQIREYSALIFGRDEINARHRKEICDNNYPIDKIAAGNYENILNALLWNNSYLPIKNSKNNDSRADKTKFLREQLQGVFAMSCGFNDKDEELIFNLCEEEIVPYIKKITHISLFPKEMKLIRETVEQTRVSASLEDDRNNNKVITLLLSIEDPDRSLRLRKNIKNLESAFLQAMTEEMLKLPVISCTAKEKRATEMVKNVIKGSSYVFIVADNMCNPEMDSLIEYTSGHSERFDSKPVVYVNTTEKSKKAIDLFSESSRTEFQIREYLKDSEILFEIARLFLSCEIAEKPKAEIRSEVLYLNGIPGVDLSDHPMFSTNTLITLRQKYAQLNEQYDCMKIENKGDVASLTELDSRRSDIATSIRQYENIICDCQMIAIGIEQTGSVLDELNTKVESFVNGGRYEEAVILLNKSDWDEEYNSAVANKVKADEVIRAYIQSRRYLIASKRVLNENNKTELIVNIYKELRKAAKCTAEYENIVYEYLAFLTDTGKYGDAEKLILEEESDYNKVGQDIRNYRFLYVAGEMYFKTGNNTLAEEYFKKAAAYVPPNNRLDYIELNAGIAKCMWMAKRYTLMYDKLKNMEEFISEEDMHSPRGKRIVSLLYRYIAIYESDCFNLKKALKLAEKALNIYAPLYKTKQGDQIQEIEDKLGYAGILNNISVLYRRMGNYDKSADLAQEVIDIYQTCASSNPEISLTKLTKACRNYSLILRRQGQYEDAERIISEAMSILDKFSYTTEKEKRQRISCLSEVGNINLDLRKYREAEEYLRKVSLLLGEINNVNVSMYEVYSAENNYDFGRLYRRMGENEKSEEYLLKAAAIWSKYSRESTGKYKVLLAQAYAELALTVEMDREKSAEYHKMSEKLIEKFSSSAREYARKKVEISLFP